MSYKNFILLIIFVVFSVVGFSQNIPQTDKSLVDSLENELQKETNLDSKVNILIKLAKQSSDSQPDKCTSYALAGIEAAKKLGNPSYEASFYMTLGNLNYEKYNHNIAIDYYEKALKIYRETNDRAGVAKVYTNMANTFDNPDKAMEYYRLSLEEFIKLKDTVDTRICYNNLGVGYSNANKPDSALIYYRKALRLSEQTNDYEGAAYALGNMGEIYLDKKQYSKAKLSFKRSLKNFEIANDLFGQLLANKNFALYYNAVNKYSKSLNYLHVALPDVQDSEYIKLREDFYLLMIKNYESLNDFKSANEYLHLLNALNDTVYNIETKKQIEARKVQLDLDKKSFEILELKNEKRINLLKLWFSLGGMVLIAAIGLILFFDKIETIRKNKIIYKQEMYLADRQHLQKQNYRIPT